MSAGREDTPGDGVIGVIALALAILLGWSPRGCERLQRTPLPTPAPEAAGDHPTRAHDEARTAVPAPRGSIPYLPAGAGQVSGARIERESSSGVSVFSLGAAGREQTF